MNGWTKAVLWMLVLRACGPCAIVSLLLLAGCTPRAVDPNPALDCAHEYNGDGVVVAAYCQVGE